MVRCEGGSESYSDPTTELINDVARTMGGDVGGVALSGATTEPTLSAERPMSGADIAEATAAAPPSPDEDGQEEVRRRRRPGQTRDDLRHLHAALTDKEDIYALLSPRQREVAQWLIETDFTVAEIAQKMHIDPATASKRATLAVANIVQRAKPENLPERLPEPEGSIIPETRENTVGSILNEIRSSLGIPLRDLAYELDVSLSALSRFFNSHSYANATDKLLPIMKILGVPPQEAEILRQQYKKERAKHNGSLKAA
jgi:plasmid maintenance system antidote protein VapI